jgi:predicted transcriptional regulator
MNNKMNNNKTPTLKLADVKEVLRAEILVGNDKLDMPVTTGASSDLMSDLLTGPTNGAVLLTGLNNIQVIRTSVIAGLAAVVFVRGKRPSLEMINHANEHGLPLLSTNFTMFTSCGRLFAKGLRGVEKKQ